MRFITLLIGVLIIFIQGAQASEHREKKMYVLFVDVDGTENKERIEKIFKRSVDGIGTDIRRKGLILSNKNSEKGSFIDFYQIRISKSGDYDKKNGRLVGALQGDVYRTGISKNCSFFIIEQEKLLSVKSNVEFTEDFFLRLELDLKQQLVEIHRVCEKENPLIFLYFSSKLPQQQSTQT